jgi:hypothetical protein
VISNLYLFALVLFRAGFLTGILPGVFLVLLVEAKYHRIQRFLDRVSEDGLDRGRDRGVSVAESSPSPEKVWRVA